MSGSGEREPVEVVLDGHRAFLVDDDLLLTDEQVARWQLTRDAARRRGEATTVEAIVDPHRDRIERWRPGTVLSYYVVASSFDQVGYGHVIESLRDATGEWQSVCGVAFRHRKAFDVASRDQIEQGQGPFALDPHEALFSVSFVDPDTLPSRERKAFSPLRAVAFFPSTPRSQRQLRLFPAFFAAGSDRPARDAQDEIMLHELGHVLGFQHACHWHLPGFEEPDEVPSNSIMRQSYSGGPRALTPLDIRKARYVYGLPERSFRYYPPIWSESDRGL